MNKASINKQVQELESQLCHVCAERDAFRASGEVLAKKMIDREAEQAAIVAKMNVDATRAEVAHSQSEESWRSMMEKLEHEKAEIAIAHDRLLVPWWKRLFGRITGRDVLPVEAGPIRCPGCGKVWEGSILDACDCWVREHGGPKKMPLVAADHDGGVE